MENMNNYAVMGDPNSKLAKKIAKKLKAKYLKTKIRIFPDGESQITVVGNSEKRKIIVVQSTHPPVNTNIIHSLFLIAKAREMSSQVCAVIPYMGYAKQDKEFLKGEIISLSIIAKLFQSAGATRIIVVDFHSTKALDFFKIPIKNLSTVDLFVQHFKKLQLINPLVVSPDLFWKENSKKFANSLDTISIALNKHRNRKTGNLTILSKKPKLTGKQDLVIFDDMVSTGGSVIKTIEFLGKKNFKRIFLACTHPVFIGNSETRLKNAGVSQIIGTNSVEGKFAKIDLSDLIVKSILDWKF